MTTVYIGERQSGKTTTLIKMCEKTGATIVVATYPMAKYIQLLAGFSQAADSVNRRSISLTSFK